MEWAVELVAQIETLPWKYTAYTPLPGKITPDALADLTLPASQGLEIIAGSSLTTTFHANGNSQHGSPAWLSNGFSWRADVFYTKLYFEGYVAKNGDSDTVHQATHQMLSLYGMALAINLLSYHAWSPRLEPEILYGMGIFRIDSTRERHITNVPFDHAQRNKLQDFWHLTPYRRSSSMEIHSKLSSLADSLSRADARLTNACRWYFDSHCGTSDQARFVQVCTALEVLLGDESQQKETGLATLMANRCAYLLGNSESARRNIIDGFKNGYHIRSRIVHAGKNRLSTREKGILQYMQDLCAAIIRVECEELTSQINHPPK